MRVTSKIEGWIGSHLMTAAGPEASQWQWEATFLIPQTPDGQMGHPHVALVLYLPSPIMGAWCQVLHIFTDPLGISEDDFIRDFDQMMEAARQMRTDAVAVPSNGGGLSA